MGEHRYHRSVLVAGFTLLGVICWLNALSTELLAESTAVRYGSLFIAAFVAAQLCRRVLVDLTIGQIAIAAAVTIGISFGILAEYYDQPLDLDMLLPLAIAEAGVIAGAITVRRPRPANHVLLVAAGGAGSFGVFVLLAAVTLLTEITALRGVATLVAVPVAGIVTVLAIPRLSVGHLMLGQAAIFGSVVGVVGEVTPALGLVGGAVIGLICGGIGGRIGEWLRDRSQRKPDLPAMRRVG